MSKLVLFTFIISALLIVSSYGAPMEDVVHVENGVMCPLPASEMQAPLKKLATRANETLVNNSATRRPFSPNKGFNETLDTVSARISGSCSNCSKAFLIGTAEVSWYQASVLCEQNGMELASIHSASEENAIENILAGYPIKDKRSNGYWISATKNGAFGTDFVWFSGGKPLIYTKFGPGQPNNYRGNENCLQLFLYEDNEYFWNDSSCAQKFGFICQTK